MRLQFLRVLPLFASLVAPGCFKSAREAHHLEKGEQFFQQKDYARAILELKSAAQAKPRDPKPYYQLGLVYLETGDLQGAVSSLLKATEIDPKYAPAQLKVAEIMTNFNDKDLLKEAKERVKTAVGASPQGPDAENILAMADLGLGDPDKAAKRLEETLQRVPGDLQTSINLAKVKLARHDVDGAAAVLKKAAATAPKSADYAMALGQFYMQMNRPTEAEAQFRHALEIDPKRALTLALLGQIQSERGQNDLAEKTFQQLSALPDKNYRHAHAVFLFASGKREEAVHEFERLATEDPGDRAARVRLVTAYVLTGRTADADRVLNGALQKNPNDVDALEQKAKLYLMLGKATPAQRELEQLLHFLPSSANGHYLLAQAYKLTGQWGLQRQELGEAVRLDPGMLKARLELARALLAIPDASASLKLLNEAPADQKKLVTWIAERNWALFGTRDYAGMRKGVDAGLAIARTRDILFQDATLKLNEGKINEAKAEMEEILKGNPEDTQVLETLVASYAAEKQVPAALQRLRQAVAARPKSEALLMLLGTYLERSGDLAGARETFEQARTLKADSAPTLLALADLDLREKKLDAARQMLAPVLDSRDRQISIQAHLLAGGLEGSAGNYQLATGHFRKVVEQDPANVVALEHLAFLLADYDNQPDEALQLAQKAEELAPTNPQVEDTLGWILYRKGMYSMALKHLEFASQPASRPRQKLHLALVYFKLGERQKGHSVLAAALKQNPDFPKSLSAQEVSAMNSN
jgi:tetratricopeptide (TPR) repeat protein